MRYHIDTIPVWDSMKLDGECLLCALRRRVELGEAERYLGASVMEPDTRIQVNEKGFCRDHHAMLYTMSNRLGHALMLESHTARTRERLKKQLSEVRKSAKAYSDSSLLDRMKKTQGARQSLETSISKVSSMVSTCIMCDSINENMERYLRTFFHLYQTDADFRKHLAESKGVCLDHLTQLIRLAPDALPAREVSPFITLLCDLTEKSMTRIQEDISWFIKKFDYRYQSQPWKTSQDAVPRTINKLRGWCVGDEPNPRE